MALDSKRRRKERLNSQDDDCVLLKSERLSDSENDTGASGDNQCSICLDTITDLAYTDACFHVFCFNCLHDWAKQKAECPQCRKPFRTITHNIRAPDDYDEHQVPGATPMGNAFAFGPNSFFLPTVQVRLQSMADRIVSMAAHGYRRRDPVNYQFAVPGSYPSAANGVAAGSSAATNHQPDAFSNEAVMLMNEAFHGTNSLFSHSITIGEYFARRARGGPMPAGYPGPGVNGAPHWNSMTGGPFNASGRQDFFGNPDVSNSAPTTAGTTVTSSTAANQPGPSTSSTYFGRPSKPSLFERFMSNLPAPTWLSELRFPPESVDYRRRVYSKRTRVDYHSRLPRSVDDAAPTQASSGEPSISGLSASVDVKPTLTVGGAQVDTKVDVGGRNVTLKSERNLQVDETDRRRVEEWLFRELLALLSSSHPVEVETARLRANAAIMARYVFELLRSGADLTGTAFSNRLRPFLADHTDRFVRELEFTIRCRLDARSLDRHARRVGRYRFTSFPAYWRSLDAESAALAPRPRTNRKRKRKFGSSRSSVSSHSNDSSHDSSHNNASNSNSSSDDGCDAGDEDDDVEVLSSSFSPRRIAAPSFFSNRFSNTATSAIVIDEDDVDSEVEVTNSDNQPQEQHPIQNGTESFNSTIRDANRLFRLLHKRWNQPSASSSSDQPSTSTADHPSTSAALDQPLTSASSVSNDTSSNQSLTSADTSEAATAAAAAASTTSAISNFDSDLLDDVLSVIGEHGANRSTLVISDGEDDEVQLVFTEPPRPIELSSSSSYESESESDSDSDSDSSSNSNSNFNGDADTLASVSTSLIEPPVRAEEPHQEGIES